MRDTRGLAEFEATVATEALSPRDFFRWLGELLAQGQTTEQGAEALRLAYLANPLNVEKDKALVRESPLPEPMAPGGVNGEASTAETSPRRRGARPSAVPEKPTETPDEPPAPGNGPSPADAPSERHERDQLLASLPRLEQEVAAHEALSTWQSAQAAFQAGQWDEARRLASALTHLPEYEGRAHELLRNVDRHQDFVLPQLNGLAAGLTSARRREAWQDVDQIWERAQALVEEEHRLGVPARLPPTLVEQYTRAKNAQEAKPLVQEAVQLRRRGEFVESDSLLAEAVKLDPDNAVILTERERCSLGTAKLASLQSILGKAHVTVPELIEGLEDAASLEQLAPDGQGVLQVARNFRRLRDETADRLARRAEQLLDEIERRASLGEKWSLCGEASRNVDDLLRLVPERGDLAQLEEQLERFSGQITRAQDLSQGLNSALEAVRAGEPLTPIQAGRIVGDLTEAQSIAPDDLGSRALGARIAEAISISLSGPEYLLRDADRFDVATFYNARELVRLLAECPGSPGAQTVEGYRHALVAKAAQAVVARLERGLADDAATSAQAPVEEALQLALALASLPGADSAQTAADLVDRVTGQMRRWVYLRFLATQNLEDVERTANEVADILVHLRSLPGTPAEAQAELEREYLSSIQQAIRHQVGPEVLQGISLAEATSRVARASEFVTYGLPLILQRLGRPERARSAALLEVLALAQEHIEQRQGRFAMMRNALPIGAIAAGAVGLIVIALVALPGLRPGSGSPGSDRVFRPEQSLAGVQGYDCVHLDDHNVCDVVNGAQFKTVYQRPDMRTRLGAPLSGQLREEIDVQYFQFGRLEYHPQNLPPHNYQFGLLGIDIANHRAAQDSGLRAARERATSDSNRGRYYLETGHHVGDRNGFQRFFDINGGIYDFGYPITDEFQSDGRMIQYFQRARFEGRPGDASSVKLGDVGIEYLREVIGARVCHRLLANLGDCG